MQFGWVLVGREWNFLPEFAAFLKIVDDIIRIHPLMIFHESILLQCKLISRIELVLLPLLCRYDISADIIRFNVAIIAIIGTGAARLLSAIIAGESLSFILNGWRRWFYIINSLGIHRYLIFTLIVKIICIHHSSCLLHVHWLIEAFHSLCHYILVICFGISENTYLCLTEI